MVPIESDQQVRLSTIRRISGQCRRRAKPCEKISTAKTYVSHVCPAGGWSWRAAAEPRQYFIETSFQEGGWQPCWRRPICTAFEGPSAPCWRSFNLRAPLHQLHLSHSPKLGDTQRMDRERRVQHRYKLVISPGNEKSHLCCKSVQARTEKTSVNKTPRTSVNRRLAQMRTGIQNPSLGTTWPTNPTKSDTNWKSVSIHHSSGAGPSGEAATLRRLGLSTLERLKPAASGKQCYEVPPFVSIDEADLHGLRARCSSRPRCTKSEACRKPSVGVLQHRCRQDFGRHFHLGHQPIHVS